MFYQHIPLVLAGATAHFFTGWILNSEFLLGKIWKQEKNCENNGKDMRLNIAMQIVASLVLAIATCVAIAIFEKAQICAISKGALEKLAQLFFSQEHSARNIMNSLHTVLFIWAGFILPTSVEEVIWCNHNWKHWALEMLSKLLSLVAIAITVTYLS